MSIGGGDEMWLYVNKVLLLEVLTSTSTAAPPCKRVDITAASQPGKSSGTHDSLPVITSLLRVSQTGESTWESSSQTTLLVIVSLLW